MRAVVQRVKAASVVVEGETVGQINEAGLLILLGITHTDGPEQINKMAEKIANLRILRTPEENDPAARTEESLLSLSAPALVVSQFTLYGSVVKGRRPSWTEAAPRPVAEPIYEQFCDRLRQLGVTVETGRFGAMMDVSLINDGPYTLTVEI
ncbi:D-aminoacyl-tRNA deacylase [Boudabousia marimammalium]|uniref:D-aminoacyl-tRNA deacylase n=1 Tax=Boudabousia marimammalium TaxID=156892 RepID=A0A1Q5PML0_9ACTO|nr:D-aminoacyl-tRNA deacylase [Boudabousia marimammalium]OKL48680.1 D-tyrosyl-tRNA(Tyr) deacylase [Boudabousia marimammalium]